MLRCRSNRTTDLTERQKKKRETEMLMLLEKCSQIAKDDRILLRNLVKENNPEVHSRLNIHKRDGDLHQLQVELRRYVHAYRLRTNDNYDFLKKERAGSSCSLQPQSSVRGTNRQPVEPLQLRLAVDQETGMIRKIDENYERKRQSNYVQPNKVTQRSISSPFYEAEQRITKKYFYRHVEDEIDRYLMLQMQDITVEYVRDNCLPETELDEESLSDSILHQYQPFYMTTNLKDRLELHNITLTEEIAPDVVLCYTPTLATTMDAQTTEEALSKQTTNNLKQNAQVWYEQFMKENSKWTVWTEYNSEKLRVTSTESNMAPVKNLSLRLENVPRTEPYLFSFRRYKYYKYQKSYYPKFGYFYKRLKRELEYV